MKICWFRMRKKWLKIEFYSFKSSKIVVHGGWKIDDGIIVNKKKQLWCIWFFANFEINKKSNNNDNFVNNSKILG